MSVHYETDGDIAVVAVAERLRRPVEQPPPDRLRGMGAALHRALGDAGCRAIGLPRLHGGIADDEDLRVAGDGEVRLDEDAAGGRDLEALLGARLGLHLGHFALLRDSDARRQPVLAGRVGGRAGL